MICIYRSKLLCWLYCFISQLRFPGFRKEIENRAKLNLFDYRGIAKPLPKCYYEPLSDNNCFGIGWSIRQYVGSTHNFINAMAEHGYFWGSYVQGIEKTTYARILLTFSDVRRGHIERVVHGKKIIPIGPYIHYAPDYYSEKEFRAEKQKMGKTLLVFFSHSATGVKVSFDLEELICKINSIRNLFQTVVVSLFWSDINNEIIHRLESEGYKIMSSGHRYDYYFLSRQKTMIKLADMTMSNSLGTHLAYCTYLQKPHWIIRQKIDSKALDTTGEANLKIERKLNEDPIAEYEQNEVLQEFETYSPTLTTRQKEICNKYFGFEYIRSEEEMKSLLFNL